MPTVYYVTPAGDRIAVEAKLGMSIMEAAIRNNVPGIEAECGGSCSCATCHVYVDPAFMPRLAPPEDMEAELLEAVAAARTPQSRLGCQVVITPELDGITLRVPLVQS
ncbi:MAG TPA: 2Fe-2S iron-sulfur cluster-binding protein [Ramlibacter sp.]|uniref:2Fe-2S iron-sulfur cluster-binding protein n=1 Tax=Ramlibacter sp. TaxID=1917967 RepID=UPI002C4EC1E5|nr:2Fe-2S iron-sulfur cluster-binding protein [Ramlibacter sp.]HVZ46614.1 2Fe-2S iron-sulfur cluster-binding protein [Ramlibacter sp.]